TGFSNFGASGGTGATALTFKDVPPNSAVEGGLGENAKGPNGTPNTQACTDTSASTNCEIAGVTAVLLHGSNPRNDVIVGSAQDNEFFNVWVSNDGITFTEFATNVDGGACTVSDLGAESCVFSGFSDLFVAVQSNVTGNVLLTAVSQPEATPEPGS